MPYAKTGDPIDRYTAMWDQGEAMMTSPGVSSRARQEDVPWPGTFHYGPPPRGWRGWKSTWPRAGAQLGALGPAAVAGGQIGLDPARRVSETYPGYIVVTTAWAQRALNGRGAGLTVDGIPGRRTMAALEEARRAVVAVRPALAESSRSVSNVGIDQRVEAYLGISPMTAPAPVSTLPEITVGPVTFEPPYTPPSAAAGGGALLLVGAAALAGVLLYRRRAKAQRRRR